MRDRSSTHDQMVCERPVTAASEGEGGRERDCVCWCVYMCVCERERERWFLSLSRFTKPRFRALSQVGTKLEYDKNGALQGTSNTAREVPKVD